MSQSVFKIFKFSASAISFGRLSHLSIMRIKKGCLKIFKVADVTLRGSIFIWKATGSTGRENHLGADLPLKKKNISPTNAQTRWPVDNGWCLLKPCINLMRFWIFFLCISFSAVAMMVISDSERNRFDQRWVQHLMRQV